MKAFSRRFDRLDLGPGTRYLDWPLPDPAGRDIGEVRGIRDEIDRLVRELVDELVP